MAKRILSLLLILTLLTAPALAVPETAAPSWILMEASTGQILGEENAHQPLAPASVTKIMTLLLVMEALEDGRISWTDTVTATAAAAGKGGSQIYLKEGESLPLEEMLKSVVVASANDCAAALAEHVAGSESAFVELMNRRAAELGMTDTHFVNCTGLDDAPGAETHLTTARDIALMSRELLRHEAIRSYTTIWMDTVRDGAFGLTNTNKLVRFYSGTTGLKTGYTAAAGYCLSATAQRDGMELIAVVMNCKTSPERFESAKALLNYGFATYCLTQPACPQPPEPIPVTLGKTPVLTPVLGESAPVLMEKQMQKGLTARMEQAEQLTAPVEKGQRVGTLYLESGGDLVAEVPLVAPEEIPRLGWTDLFSRLLGGVCMKQTR